VPLTRPALTLLVLAIAVVPLAVCQRRLILVVIHRGARARQQRPHVHHRLGLCKLVAVVRLPPRLKLPPSCNIRGTLPAAAAATTTTAAHTTTAASGARTTKTRAATGPCPCASGQATRSVCKPCMRASA